MKRGVVARWFLDDLREKRVVNFWNKNQKVRSRMVVFGCFLEDTLLRECILIALGSIVMIHCPVRKK